MAYEKEHDSWSFLWVNLYSEDEGFLVDEDRSRRWRQFVKLWMWPVWEGFRSGNFLDLHIWIEENGLIIFKCDICEMAADSGIGLNSHIKAKHIEFYGIFVSWRRLRIMRKRKLVLFWENEEKLIINVMFATSELDGYSSWRTYENQTWGQWDGLGYTWICWGKS